MDNLTPVTIFSGYLGAGKTTMILKALEKTSERMVLLKNEYGDASVDGALVRERNIAVKELVNGCLCCVLVGSLNAAVDELLAMHPDRILIEASGNALPFPIVLELKKNKRVYVDGVVWVVDCVNFSGIKDKSVVAREQAKYTDLIVFNKVGLVDEKKLYQVKEDVFDLNPNARSVETVDGYVNPQMLFGLEHIAANEKQPVHGHDELETFVYTTDTLMDREKVEQVLRACEPGKFYRIKGVIKISNDKFQMTNVVFGRIEFRDIEMSENSHTKIVFIGKDILKWQETIEDYLDKAMITPA